MKKKITISNTLTEAKGSELAYMDGLSHYERLKNAMAIIS
jgi:hypothetical protein